MRGGFAFFQQRVRQRIGSVPFRRFFFRKHGPGPAQAPPPPPPLPPPQRPYFDISRYKTVWSKAAASFRYGLNRFQPWTADHRLAIASWMAVGTVWWAVAGTTTLLSVVMFVIPSERFQALVAQRVSEHVTRYTGATVTFESAIQPSWKTLRFRDVRIWALIVSSDVCGQVTVKRTEESCGMKDSMEIDLKFDQVDVKVSLLWFLEGKSLIESATIRGVRGVLDRRKCWNVYNEAGELIPLSEYVPEPVEDRWRSKWYKGSVCLNYCSVTDAEITLLEFEPQRPLKVVCHQFESNRLRLQYLLYDLLCSTVDGAVDDRLFSLRPPPGGGSDPLVHETHFHMDGMNIDILRAGGATGPLAWLTRGRIDVNAEYRIPRGLGTPEAAARLRGQHVRVKVDLNLTHLNASVPLGDQRISYLNAALIQPMIVYLNTNYVSIPLRATLSIPLEYYDGAWSPYAAAMTDALSEAVGVELSARVADQKKPKNVFWLLIKGVDGMWRATKYSAYVIWHGYLFE